MNLMKWFRKNNKKIMAIVVVIIMFAFIAGPAMRYFARIGMGRHDEVAYYADNREITSSDVILARQELETLQSLETVVLLRAQDLRAILLGELLFSEQRTSPVVINRVKRMIAENGYRISDKQISDVYNRSVPANYYWLLLEKEADFAGISVTTESVGKLLGQVLPQLFKGATYSQVIQSIINKQGIPEEQILTTFGKLLAVLQYSHMICSDEDVASSQIMHMASRENETINVDLVEFESSVFANALYKPNEAVLVEHFDKYKKFFAKTPSEENPCGFGYKLPDRVQIEYIAVKLDDVSKIVTPPTNQEKEQYYQRNIQQQFKESVPSDPNDPNSLKIERTKSYAEVAGFISNRLLQDKINSEAEKILQDAKTLTSADSYENKKEGDYTTAAEQLSKKYKIKIYTGQTGLLAATDFQADKNLRTLYLGGYANNPVRLAQIVFAIDEFKAGDLRLFNMPRPKMHENIGPLRDLFGKIMVLVCIIKAEPASEPQSIDQTFSTKGLILDPNQYPESENTYSVREKVTADLNDIAAMDTTRSKAEEFVKLAKKDGWDRAINKFNELYGKQVKKEPNEPNVFRLQTLTDLRRISNATLRTLAVQIADNPLVQLPINENAKQFVDKLYSLVPQDSNSIDNAGLIMEFKPDMSFYIIKDISVKRLDQAEYERIKTRWLYREDHIQTQSMAAEFFNPENILKRMNFRWAKRDEKARDANKLPQSEEQF